MRSYEYCFSRVNSSIFLSYWLNIVRLKGSTLQKDRLIHVFFIQFTYHVFYFTSLAPGSNVLTKHYFTSSSSLNYFFVLIVFTVILQVLYWPSLGPMQWGSENILYSFIVISIDCPTYQFFTVLMQFVRSNAQQTSMTCSISWWVQYLD